MNTMFFYSSIIRVVRMIEYGTRRVKARSRMLDVFVGYVF